MSNFILRRTLILSLLFTSVSSLAGDHDRRLIYRNEILYDRDHWALATLTPADPIFVARVMSHETSFVIILNPTDARGYRAVVALEDRDMASTLNRPFTLKERLGLNAVLATCQNIYEGFHLIAQAEVLGNNAHVFDPVLRKTLMGQEHEPAFLHGHVVGRGDPLHEYIPGVALRGPNPGEIFEHRGQKIRWTAAEIEIVRGALAEQFWLRRFELEKYGIFVGDLAPFSASGLPSGCDNSLMHGKGTR